ncbi:MAG: hypothetical protein LBM93_02535 [Oscillospiraceae bacterium]|jgi:hypothetical protein|nr:hypothetical protein [Oscillospiraceae bacterium]
MNMDDYKPNTKEYRKPETEKVDKVVKGLVKSKKKNGVRKIIDIFINEDIGNVKTYVIFDVLVPTIKKAISDVVKNTTDMLLYGENTSKNKTTASKVSYNKYYTEDKRDDSKNKVKTSYNYDDIIFDNRGEAEEVLSRMDELVDTYGIVSVADLYDMVGISGNYTDNKYGWTDIHSATVVRVKEGYMIRLPRVTPIN